MKLNNTFKKEIKKRVEYLKKSSYITINNIIELSIYDILLNAKNTNQIELNILNKKDNNLKDNNKFYFFSTYDLYPLFNNLFELKNILMKYIYNNLLDNYIIKLNNKDLTELINIYYKLNNSEVLTTTEINTIILKNFNL